MRYQPIHAPEDLLEFINEKDSFNNKIQTNHLDSNRIIIHDDPSDNYKDDG